MRRDDYRLIPSTERIGAAYSAADLVVSRAGSSVWELAAAGKPAILVPYPFATADHQALNAEHFVRAGGAMMIRDLDLDDVPDRVRSLLDDEPRLERMSEAMLRVAKPNAAEEIAEGLIDLADVLTGAGSGSSGSAGPACPPMRSSPARGAPRSEGGTGSRRRTSTPLGGGRDRDLAGPVVPAGWEAVVSSAYPAVAGTPRAELLAELVGRAPLDRRRAARTGRGRRRR